MNWEKGRPAAAHREVKELTPHDPRDAPGPSGMMAMHVRLKTLLLLVPPLLFLVAVAYI